MKLLIFLIGGVIWGQEFQMTTKNSKSFTAQSGQSRTTTLVYSVVEPNSGGYVDVSYEVGATGMNCWAYNSSQFTSEPNLLTGGLRFTPINKAVSSALTLNCYNSEWQDRVVTVESNNPAAKMLGVSQEAPSIANFDQAHVGVLIPNGMINDHNNVSVRCGDPTYGAPAMKTGYDQTSTEGTIKSFYCDVMGQVGNQYQIFVNYEGLQNGFPFMGAKIDRSAVLTYRIGNTQPSVRLTRNGSKSGNPVLGLTVTDINPGDELISLELVTNYQLGGDPLRLDLTALPKNRATSFTVEVSASSINPTGRAGLQVVEVKATVGRNTYFQPVQGVPLN